MKRKLWMVLGWSALLLLGACGEGSEPVPSSVEEDSAGRGSGGKTDLPDELPEDSCTKRRADVLNGNQRVFTRDAIRWSCADVEGVNNNNQDDRGQEYCEYFAVVQLPPIVEGDLAWPDPFTVGQIEKVEEDEQGFPRVVTTPLDYRMTEDQIFYLEDHEDTVLGQCVFTSWHADVPGPLPGCQDGETCPDVLGIPLREDVFRMKLGANTNEAASALVEECLVLPEGGDLDDPDDLFHSDFYRGCFHVADLYQTQWRRSDPSVCAAAVRLAECGCGLRSGKDLFAELLPAQPHIDASGKEEVTLRGFPLGSWSSVEVLPAGCRHAPTGDGSQTVVTCDLTAADLLNYDTDLKRRCVEKYGNDVVVYVPIPADEIVCDPASSDSPYAETCSDMPWVIEQ